MSAQPDPVSPGQALDARRDPRGDVHAARGRDDRAGRAAVDPEGPARELHEPAVGDRRLCARARGVHPDQRIALRPPRAQARVPRRRRDLHARLSPLRPRDRPRLPRRGAGDPGRRRCRDVRDLARADRPGVHRPGPRQGDRLLGSHGRRRRRSRPARRRRTDRGVRLAVDLPREPSDRDRRDRACREQDPERPRSRRAPHRFRRVRHVRGRSRAARLRSPPRGGARLVEHGHPRLLCRRRDPRRRVRLRRAASEAADVRSLALPAAGVRRRPARDVRDRGRDVRGASLPHALPPERAPLLAARGWAADAAVDGDGVRRSRS